jgi:L-iditol 2-dehydrogenase
LKTEVPLKAIAKVARGPGHVELIDVPKPKLEPGHALIEVHVAGICGTDLHIAHDRYPTNPPVVLGHELSGVVAQVADDVTGCRPGQRVTSETYFTVCGECRFCRSGAPNLCRKRLSIGSGVDGAFARYVLVPAINVHPLPDGVDDRGGALTEPLACALHALERTCVAPGDVAIISGPGAIGLLTMQVARAAGARTVVLGTAADTERLELARDLGAEETIDVTASDAVDAVRELTHGSGADIVFECSGAPAAARAGLAMVRRQGRYAQVGLFGRPLEWDLEQVCFKEIQVSGSFATVSGAWRRALALLASGQIDAGRLVSHVLPMSKWERAFDMAERKEGLKIALRPTV